MRRAANMSESVILFGVFVVLLLCNVPIAVSLGVPAVLSCLVAGYSPSMLPINAYAATHKFSLLAIPFFIVSGNIMEKAGISEKLINLASACVGHFRSGLALVTVICSCFFAAISGSGPATVAALGTILIPAMAAAGYPISFGAALMAAAGAIGLIIPPSVTFIVYGSISGASVGRMFMAGVIPGIMMGIALAICSMILTKKMDIKLRPRASSHERWVAFKDAIWALLMPVIILGGIYGGIFTPTEAAAVSAVYGLIVGVFIYRKMRFGEFIRCIVDSMAQNGQVLFVMICAALFAWMVAATGMTTTIGNALISLSSGNLIIFLLITNLILLFAGCIMDANSALYILVPILLPVAQELGYDSVAFGILMCVNLAIGLITPPVGVNLYTACSIAKISLRDIIKWVLPLIGFLLIVLLLVTYIPQISLFLPSLMS